ncbi:DUF1841 family protein [Derxia gummosa]|uniref:DUF1841 family protein n=1 Tax=Derxia gummosa DSM 723 TaxID=1121388 RepID=A0A8B6X0S3_9BURK|nr:DUF1841 family protein [Derxia gummosa]
MFNPSRDQVREFFRNAWRKHVERLPLEPLEAIAADWIAEHPEYHDDLAATVEVDYSIDAGRTNPFLHLSMHLSLAEQVQVDQPRGIKAAVETLARRAGSLHEAHHAAMDCLGEMLWTAQRSSQPPDGEAYVDCVRRKAG